MENWRKFLNEEETTLQNLNDLLFGDDKHPGEYEVICGGSVKVLRHEIEDTGTLALEVEFI